MKLQGLKESTRSAANVDDDESPEEYVKDRDNRKWNIRDFVGGGKGQKFQIKARQVMEERYGAQTKTVEAPSLQKELVEIRLFKKSAYYKALE